MSRFPNVEDAQHIINNCNESLPVHFVMLHKSRTRLTLSW
jgi:hypothetical protein